MPSKSKASGSDLPNGLYRIPPSPNGKRGGRWKVMINRMGFRFHRKLSDRRFGNPERSKAAAMELIKRVNEVLPPKFLTERRLRSGRGVHRTRYYGGCWSAVIYVGGVTKWRHFPIDKYGNAKRLAEQARQKMLQTVGNRVTFPDQDTLARIQQEVFKKYPRAKITRPHQGYHAKPFYGITRIEGVIDAADGWVVHLRRRGRTLHQRFPDAKHSGKRKALTAARAWRDQQIATNRPLTKKEYVSLIRNNNTSGHPGVWRAYCKKIPQWITRVNVGNKFYSRYFSINKYGEAEAYELAVKAREELVKQYVRGYYLTGGESAKRHVEGLVGQRIGTTSIP